MNSNPKQSASSQRTTILVVVITVCCVPLHLLIPDSSTIGSQLILGTFMVGWSFAIFLCLPFAYASWRTRDYGQFKLCLLGFSTILFWIGLGVWRVYFDR